MSGVKRLQIMIEEDLDSALARQAREEGVSKAALIRRYVRDRLRPLPPIEEDPLWDRSVPLQHPVHHDSRHRPDVHRVGEGRELRRLDGGGGDPR